MKTFDFPLPIIRPSDIVIVYLFRQTWLHNNMSVVCRSGRKKGKVLCTFCILENIPQSYYSVAERGQIRLQNMLSVYWTKGYLILRLLLALTVTFFGGSCRFKGTTQTLQRSAGILFMLLLSI